MLTTQRLFQFQIVTDTPKEAAQFMKEVEAFDVSIEETWYIFTMAETILSTVVALESLTSKPS